MPLAVVRSTFARGMETASAASFSHTGTFALLKKG